MKIIETSKLNLWYGTFQALIGVDLAVEQNRITALIGPSGCGKSTLLRVFNRMNDLIDGVRVTGSVKVGGEEITGAAIDLIALRKKVGMVFQRPNPFPLSIYENVVYALRIHGIREQGKLDEAAERALTSVLLWDEMKDQLGANALTLSLEQQQRLCIARLLAVTPDVVLMDEPCSALDPLATMRIEELMIELKKQYSIVIVTHNMQQAARISDDCGYMLLGELVEFAGTKQIFTTPRDKRTEDYITGRFG
ncbi:MAG TPA: phosphate ABC transporter ATP-binding protein PstB [Candidatus Sulfotelmatobacter sp.]|nr:phosphate ABC transporter ATP-binding protein PstB [Candidatus Sulfotelmatobacter sp.]